MPGFSKIIENIRREVAQSQTFSRKRFSEVQKQLDEIVLRLDRIELPAQTQTGAPARKAAASRSSNASSSRKSSAKRGATNKRAVPIPERPDPMKDAGVGTDPR